MKRFRSGQAAEARFFQIVERRLSKFPPWMLFVAPAPRALDIAGVDATVDIDCGRLYLNIKNSVDAKHYFESREERREIPCILVRNDDSDEGIFQSFLEFAERGRAQILRHRAQGQPLR